jgi:hypothetical protein
MRELDHCDSLWPEEKYKGDDPEPNCHAAIGRNTRHNVEVEHSHNEKRDEIPPPQRAP